MGVNIINIARIVNNLAKKGLIEKDAPPPTMVGLEQLKVDADGDHLSVQEREGR